MSGIKVLFFHDYSLWHKQTPGQSYMKTSPIFPDRGIIAFAFTVFYKTGFYGQTLPKFEVVSTGHCIQEPVMHWRFRNW